MKKWYIYLCKQLNEVQNKMKKQDTINKAQKLLNQIFPNKKFDLTYRDWDNLVTVRKEKSSKVFGYIEVSTEKSSFLAV